MGNGPGLVIRGALVGSIVVIFFSLAVTANVSFPPVARAESLPVATVTPPPDVAVLAQPEVMAENPDQQCLVSDRFPTEIFQWCGLISGYADANGLLPDLVAALVMQESAGNTSAYSHSGAVGLMQVMPSDGLAANFMCKNGPCFAARPTSSELYDPEFNIQYGTRMLAGLLNRHGNYRDALRAYGPMDVGYYYADRVLGIYERYRS